MKSSPILHLCCWNLAPVVSCLHQKASDVMFGLPPPLHLHLTAVQRGVLGMLVRIWQVGGAEWTGLFCCVPILGDIGHSWPPCLAMLMEGGACSPGWNRLTRRKCLRGVNSWRKGRQGALVGSCECTLGYRDLRTNSCFHNVAAYSHRPH